MANCDWTAESLLVGKRRRWFCVIATIVLSGGAVLPGVDRSLARSRELGELRVRLAERDALPQRARTLQDRVEQLRRDTAHLEAVLVTADQLSLFKQDVTRMARDARCRLRSIHPGAAVRRTLDEVLGLSHKPQVRRGKGGPLQWQVDAQVSSVSVQGSFADLMTFLSALDGERRALQVTTMHLHPFLERSDDLILDLQIQTINLVRG